MTISVFRDAAPAGTQIRGIVLSRAVAQGGEGIVYEAVHPELGSVLVKEFWPKQIVSRARSLRAQPALTNWQDDYRLGIERFIALAERLRDLPQHPGVLTVREIIPQNNTAYLVMDRVPGVTLEAALEAGGFNEAPDIERLAAKLGAAMEHLHANGLFHRDIAPDNIMITPGHDWEAVLIDFNAAKDIVLKASRSQEGIVKPGYTPIEQYDTSGKEPLGPWTDIYAAAAVLYRCVTGRPPADPAMRLLRPDQETLLSETFAGRYPASLLAAIDLGLRPQPDERPRSVEQWREQLEAEQRARAAAEAKAKADAEAKVRAEEEARAKAEADRLALIEAEVRAKLEAEMRDKIEQETRAKAAEEAKLKATEEKAQRKTDKEAEKRAAEEEAAAAALAAAATEAAGAEPPEVYDEDVHDGSKLIGSFDRRALAALAAALAVIVLAWALWPNSADDSVPLVGASSTALVADAGDATDAATEEEGAAGDARPTPTPSARPSATPRVADARPTQTPRPAAVCRADCIDGYYAETRRTVGPRQSIGDVRVSDNQSTWAGRANAAAAARCGGEATNVSIAGSECPLGDLCFLNVNYACVQNARVRSNNLCPAECR